MHNFSSFQEASRIFFAKAFSAAPSSWDEYWMQRALRLAVRAAGWAQPNPLVGAILVKRRGSSTPPLQAVPSSQAPLSPKDPSDISQWDALAAQQFLVLGEGWHMAYGLRHAEVMAIEEAYCQGHTHKEVQEATLYCNLEPCCFVKVGKHQGPCSQRIIQEGIKEVVIANPDPNPDVHLKGIAQLRASGIAVRHGVLAEQAARINQGFFSRMLRGRPWVVLKMAQSLDGCIATASGESQWITGPAARSYTQALRFLCGSVMVGSGTVRKDNPSLLLRPEWQEYLREQLAARAEGYPSAPLAEAQSQSLPQIERIIWNSDLSLAARPELRIFSEDAARSKILYSSSQSSKISQQEIEERAVQCIELGSQPCTEAYLREGLEQLCAEERQPSTNCILLEGGAQLSGSLLRAGLVDEIFCFSAPLLLGQGLRSSGKLEEQGEVKALAAYPRLQEPSYHSILEEATEFSDELLTHGYLSQPLVPSNS